MRKAIIIVVIFNILRLAFIPFVGLTPQESYFAYYADNLSLSYFDHPPLIGYIIWLFMAVLGHNMYAVKIASFVVIVLAQLAFLLLASKILRGERKYLAWVLFCTSMLVTSMSLQNGPDVPLVLFWTLSIWAFYCAIFEKSVKHWIYAGIFMGLALNSKFPALGIPIGLIIFLIFSGRHRKLLAQPWLYLSILIMLLLALPMLVWNIRNDFITFRLPSVLRAEPFDSDTPRNVFQFILSQVIILMPVLFIGLWWLFGKYLWRIITKPNQTNAEMWFLFSFFFPAFIGVYLVSVFGEVKYNWLIPTYITGIIMISKVMKERWQFWHWALTSVLYVVCVYKIVLAPNSPYVRYDLGLDSEQLAHEVDSVHAANPNTFVFATDGYKTASKISFYSGDTIYGPQIIAQTPYHFGYIGLNANDLKNKNGLLVKPRLNSNTQFHLIVPYFDEVRKIHCVKVAGVPAYDIFYCENYKGIEKENK